MIKQEMRVNEALFFTLGVSFFTSAFIFSRLLYKFEASVIFVIAAAFCVLFSILCVSIRSLSYKSIIAFIITVTVGVTMGSVLTYYCNKSYNVNSVALAGSTKNLKICVVSDNGQTTSGNYSYYGRLDGLDYKIKLYTSDKLDCNLYDYINADVKFYDDTDDFLKGNECIACGYIKKINNSYSTDQHSFMKSIVRLRLYIGGVIDKYISEYRSYARALLLADKNMMSSAEKNTVSGAGVSYIMAVSGFHVSVLSGIIMYLMSLLRVRKSISSLISIIILFIFAALCGFVPSCVRSVIMIGACSFSYIFGIRCDAKNILGLTVCLMLVTKPLLIYNISFLLSVSATFAIIALFPVLRHEMIKWYFLHIRMRFEKTVMFITDLFLLGVSCFICTLPFCYIFFGKTSAISLVSNIVCMPIMQITLVLCFITILIGIIPIFNFIPSILGTASSFGLKIFASLTEAFDKLSVNMDYHVLIAGAVCGIICFAVFNFKNKNKRYLLPILITIALFVSGSFLFNVRVNLNNNTCDSYFVCANSGQGESNIIIDGHDAAIIDCGGNNYPGQHVADYLKSKNIKEIKYIILSHLHEDHAGDVEYICQKYKVGKIIVPYTVADRNMLDIIKQTACRYNIELCEVNNDCQYCVGQVVIDVLTRHLHEPTDDDNDNSIVCVCRRGQFKYLCCGDLTARSEDSILRIYGCREIDCLSLAVGHHGSKYSSTYAFLDAVSPLLSVIPVGRNTYGHPAEQTYSRLCEYGNVMRTDKSGGVEIRTDGNHAEVYEINEP